MVACLAFPIFAHFSVDRIGIHTTFLFLGSDVNYLYVVAILHATFVKTTKQTRTTASVIYAIPVVFFSVLVS